ncbi:MAG: hypothetical protein JO004_10830 [Methylobacteriaceae bacterium]|nr:hypothetical protein [Methylobacteriaceae bacterium]
MQRFIFQAITVGRWITSVVVSTIATLFWLAIGAAVAGVAEIVCRHLAGSSWWIAAGVATLLEIVFVVPGLIRAVQGFLFPGVINQAHGHARVATLRDVRRAGVWQS